MSLPPLNESGGTFDRSLPSRFQSLVLEKLYSVGLNRHSPIFFWWSSSKMNALTPPELKQLLDAVALPCPNVIEIPSPRLPDPRRAAAGSLLLDDQTLPDQAVDL